MKKMVWLLVFISALLLVVSASAATLTLPSSLINIEEESFAGDTSLDQVVLGNKTQVVGPRAFADSSVKKVTMPASIHYIADNAFEGVNGLTVNAAEGTYAYTWAVEHEYIKIPEVPTGAVTKVIMPEKLQAGADLEIQIFGPANTVSHTVFLINNATKKGETRWIKERNGIAYWEGFELENGTYTVKVYTVTDNYSGSNPVSKDLVISGKRPAGPEDIELPEKIGWNGAEINYRPYDGVIIQCNYYDEKGSQINSNVFRSWPEDDIVLVWHGNEETTSIQLFIRSYQNGLWSEWSSETVIEVIDGYVNKNLPELKSLFIPDNIIEGRDIEISYEFDKEVAECWIYLRDEHDQPIIDYYESNITSSKIIIPGYKMEAGTYNFHMNATAYVEGELYDYSLFDKELKIQRGRKPGNIIFAADKTSVYTNENIKLSITSNGTEGAYVKIVGDKTTYKGCNLQENGEGNCSTTLNVLYSETKTKTVTLSACVFLGDSWSEWSDPITIAVSRPEPLPVPVIGVKDNYETGEDIVVSVTDIEDADYYYVYFEEYFSGETISSKYFTKREVYLGPTFGENVIFSGTLFGTGTYRIRVRATSSLRGYSEAKKTVKVSGTRSAAPEVSIDPAVFRINQTTTFTIDTTGCEEVNVGYNAYSGSSFTPTGNSTKWTYQFTDDAKDISYSFYFSVKRNGKWSYSKEISQTVLGLPQLDPAVIHVDDVIEAGADFTISVDPVENATRYECRIIPLNGGFFPGFQGYGVRSGTFAGYGDSFPTGEYTAKVWAYSDDYASSVSEKNFSIVGKKPSAPTVSVDKTEYFSNENRPIFTVKAKGAEAIRCNNGSVFIPDEDGNVSYTYNTYLEDQEERVVQVSFCYVRNKVWSEWSEPISIKIKKAPQPAPLDKPVINLPDDLSAGRDFTFSFNKVDGATSYEAYIKHYYVDSSLYSDYPAEAETDMLVSGRLLAAGRYKAIVYAKAEGRTTSSSEVEFTVTGERGEAPVVTSDKMECGGGETITFTIDTEGVEEVYASYNSTGNYYTSNNQTLIPQSNSTEWTYSVPSYFYGTTYTFSFNVKRDEAWSKPKTITIQIPEQSGE